MARALVIESARVVRSAKVVRLEKETLVALTELASGCLTNNTRGSKALMREG